MDLDVCTFANQITAPPPITDQRLSFAVTCTVHDYPCQTAQLYLLHMRACFSSYDYHQYTSRTLS